MENYSVKVNFFTKDNVASLEQHHKNISKMTKVLSSRVGNIRSGSSSGIANLVGSVLLGGLLGRASSRLSGLTSELKKSKAEYYAKGRLSAYEILPSESSERKGGFEFTVSSEASAYKVRNSQLNQKLKEKDDYIKQVEGENNAIKDTFDSTILDFQRKESFSKGEFSKLKEMKVTYPPKVEGMVPVPDVTKQTGFPTLPKSSITMPQQAFLQQSATTPYVPPAAAPAAPAQALQSPVLIGEMQLLPLRRNEQIQQ